MESINWNEILKEIGGLAVVVSAVVGAIAWVARSTINQFFAKELTAFEGEINDKNARGLAELKQEHARQLQDLQAEANKQLAQLNSTLARVEKLEEELARSRGEGYGEIWGLTGALNLFGPADAINSRQLSTQLKQWYFEYGWVLSDESKSRYFLAQEALNFGITQLIPYQRPADDLLYGGSERPVAILDQLRSQLLGVEAPADQDEYTAAELVSAVKGWKSRILSEAWGDSFAEPSWVLLQLLLSAFRTRITKELWDAPQRHYGE